LQIKNNEEKAINELSVLKNKIDNWEITLKKNNKTENPELKKNISNEIWRKNKLAEIDTEIQKKSSLRQSIGDLERRINEFSGNLFASAKFLTSEFKIGNNLKEFFESFDIGIGEQRDISLRLRGDGVQAKFIPEMLNFLDEIQTKKYSIWGFEEPENSAEYKNQQILAGKFKDDFSKRKQIFLTTHSEEFLSMYDDAKIEKDERTANLYHVKKIIHKRLGNEFSVINLFDVEKQTFDFATTRSNLEEDIGTSLIRAKYSKELKEKENNFLKDKEKFEQEILKANEEFKQQMSKFNNAFPDKIFICEDERGRKVWEKFFKEFDVQNVTVIPSKGCTVNDVEIWIRENRKRDQQYNPKVFRNLDRDGYTQEQVDFLEAEIKRINEQSIGNGKYEIKFLPVNELENFAVLSDEYFTDELLIENIDSLEDKFTLTVTSSLNQNHRKFSNDTNLFNHHTDQLLIKNMEREAKKNPKKYFPGKDIKVLKNNFNAERVLKNLSVKDYPKSLTKYLKEIKQFFEN
jgi:hypothetical protein